MPLQGRGSQLPGKTTYQSGSWLETDGTFKTGEVKKKFNKGDIYKGIEPTMDELQPEVSTRGNPLLTLGLKRQRIEKILESDECRGLLVRSCGHQQTTIGDPSDILVLPSIQHPP